MFAVSKWLGIPIILSLLIKIGFIQYFTKVDWKRSVIVGTVMNAVSATIGTYLIGILGLIIDMAWLFDFYAKLGMSLFHWTHFLMTYVFAIFVNILIEGDIVKIIMKLPISKTFRWLFFANAISIGICMICFALDAHYMSLSEAIGIPIFVMCIYGAYLAYCKFIKKKEVL